MIAARACQCKTVVSGLYQGACWASGNLKVRKPLSSQFIVRVANVIMMYYYTDTSYHPLHQRHLQTSPFLSPDSRTVGCLASGSRPHHWERGRTCTIETLTRCTAHKSKVQVGDSHGLNPTCVNTRPVVIWMDKHRVLMVHRLSAGGQHMIETINSTQKSTLLVYLPPPSACTPVAPPSPSDVPL